MDVGRRISGRGVGAVLASGAAVGAARATVVACTALAAAGPLSPAPPALGAGDCMVVGFNTGSQIHPEPPDDFAVVLLAPLYPGEQISATDDGWRTDVSPHAFDGRSSYNPHVVHTAAAQEQAGTVLTAADFSASLDLSRRCDKLIVYRGA